MEWRNRWYITIRWNRADNSPAGVTVIERVVDSPAELRYLVDRARADPHVVAFPYRQVHKLVPIGPATLGTRLRRHGIPVGAARNTALIALAAELPAAVIDDLFGLTYKTASACSNYAQADWTAYLNSRPTSDFQKVHSTGEAGVWASPP
ncbi:hypothetical protein ACFYPX_09295 [Micromonospora zamorensis]|uniref:hypothetical protein n=1 Tax=Micromonospora zamorensis TaxID=709883 RepID=UPI003691BE6A